MSETVTAPATIVIPKTLDSLLSPQFILLNEAMLLVGIVAGAVIWRGDASQINLVLGAVIGYGSAVMQFYFGSSRSSQAKDDVIASKVPAPEVKP